MVGTKKTTTSPKKLRKAQKVAKKASQLDDNEGRGRIQRLRKKQASDMLDRYLEYSLDGMKSDIQKCSIIRNFEEETAKFKQNECQRCRMVRLDLKLTKKGICKKCASLKNENTTLMQMLCWYGIMIKVFRNTMYLCCKKWGYLKSHHMQEQYTNSKDNQLHTKPREKKTLILE